MTTPIECTTSTTPFSSEEIDRRLAEWLKSYKAHVHIIDLPSKQPLQFQKVTWEEFFSHLKYIKSRYDTLVIIKEQDGASVIFREKDYAKS